MNTLNSILQTLGVFDTFQAITEPMVARSHGLYHFQRELLDNMHSRAMVHHMYIASQFENGLYDMTLIHSYFTQIFHRLEEQLAQNTANYLTNEEIRAEIWRAMSVNEHLIVVAQRHYLESRGHVFNTYCEVRHTASEFMVAQLNISLEIYREAIHNAMRLAFAREALESQIHSN